MRVGLGIVVSVLIWSVLGRCQDAGAPDRSRIPAAGAEVEAILESVGRLGTPDDQRAAWAHLNPWMGSADNLAKLVPVVDRFVAAIDRARADARREKPSLQDWLDVQSLTWLVEIGAMDAAGDLAARIEASVDREVGPSLALKLAFVHEQGGDLARADTWLERLSATEGPMAIQASALRGEIALRRGATHEALRCFEQQSRLAREKKDDGLQFLAGINLARIELVEGFADRCVEALDELRVPKELPRASEIAYLQVRAVALGALAERPGSSRGLVREAQDVFQRLLERATAEADIELANAGLARCALALGDSDGARRHVEALDGSASLEASLRTFEMQYAMAGDLEDSAARSLLTEGRAHLRRFLAQRDQLAARPGGEGFLAYRTRRSLVEALITLTLRLEGASACWQPILDVQARSTRALAAGDRVEPMTVDGLRSSPWTASGGLLCFLLAHDRGYVLGLDRDGAFAVEIPGWFGLVGTVRAARRAWNAGFRAAGSQREYADGVVAALTALGDAVLPSSVRDRIGGWQTLVYCDYGCLAGLPLEAVTWKPGGLMGERFAMSQSASFAVDAAARLPGGREVVLARHTVDVLDDEWKRLVSASGERARAFDATGTDAKWETPFGMPIGAAGVLHLVAHGEGMLEGEFYRRARLADGAPWTFETVRESTLQGLVVLSVCGVGEASELIGEGPFHASLGGAALLAGAHTVVQSTLDLRIASHVEFLRAFYGALADSPTAEALRDARARLAREASIFERLQNASMAAFGAAHLAPLR